MNALSRAERALAQAAAEGFRWPTPIFAWRKVVEETEEVRETIATDADHARQADELGDLLLAAVNLARELDVDPTQALEAATAKFAARFAIARENGFADASPEALAKVWDAAKRAAD